MVNHELVSVVCSVGSFSYVGVLFRILLTDFSESLSDSGCTRMLDGFRYHGYLLPNIVGCVVMSFLLRYRERLSQLKYGMYAGLSTGMCGCLTTFSTWNQVSNMSFVDGDILDGIMVIGVTHCICVCCLHTFQPRKPPKEGSDTNASHVLHNGNPSLEIMNPSAEGENESSATELRNHPQLVKRNSNIRNNNDSYIGEEGATVQQYLEQRDVGVEPHITVQADLELQRERVSSATDEYTQSVKEVGEDARNIRQMPVHLNWEVVQIVVFASLSFVVWLVVGLSERHRSDSVAIGLAPFGALIRWRLSQCNSRTPDLPLYTLAANLLGCIVTASFSVVKLEVGDDASDWGGVLIHAIPVGFAGSLSTVSSFMAEVVSLRRLRFKYRYCLITYLSAQVVLALINGTYRIVAE